MGGGGISDPKNYIADFVDFKAVYFGEKKRNVIFKKNSLQIYAYLMNFLEKSAM